MFYKVKLMLKLLLIFIYLLPSVFAATNLGTLNTVKNGLATVKECYNGENDISCSKSLLDGHLSDILPLASLNMCLANDVNNQSNGHVIPDCPSGDEQIQGLDNTYPSGAIFSFYNGRNDSFIYELFTNYKNRGGRGQRRHTPFSNYDFLLF
jgi:hypothetical protein